MAAEAAIYELIKVVRDEVVTKLGAVETRLESLEGLLAHGVKHATSTAPPGQKKQRVR